MENKNLQKGKVILAGAGPGDADLITVKLSKALRTADVIISDRLVNNDIIKIYSKPEAEIIFAGKQGFSDASISMEEINQLITQHALLGKMVVRLKGGDVAFFSNVLAELENLIEHQIDFEIIPGITAASGASAFAGIPLTARGYSEGVQFISYNPKTAFPDTKWEQLASTHDTLVFYMSASTLKEIVSQLISHGKNVDLPLAVIEQATTLHQRVRVTTLANYAVDFARMEFTSPSLVIIGEVVNLHTSFDWFKPSKAGTIFKQLA